MKKFNSFFLLSVVGLFLIGCNTRQGPPAPVSYGTSSPEPLNASPQPLLQREKLPSPDLKPKTILVGENETLVTIAQKTNTPAYKIIALNNLKKPFTLKPGQQLRLTEDAPTLTKVPVVEEEFTAENQSQEDIEHNAVITPPSKPKRKLTEAEKELLTSLEQEKKAMLQEEKPKEKQDSHLLLNTDEKPSFSRATTPSGDDKVSQTPPTSGPQIEKAPVQEQEKMPEAKKMPLETPKFTWPVKGKIISRFGPGQGALQNDGINIAAPEGTPIVAIEEGVVVYAGNEMQGFGNLILIKHPGGWMSSYGHAAKILIERGTKVQKGASIGLVGNTGSVNEPQLHFELRNMKKGGKVVNPELYLE